MLAGLGSLHEKIFGLRVSVKRDPIGSLPKGFSYLPLTLPLSHKEERNKRKELLANALVMKREPNGI